MVTFAQKSSAWRGLCRVPDPLLQGTWSLTVTRGFLLDPTVAEPSDSMYPGASSWTQLWVSPQTLCTESGASSWTQLWLSPQTLCTLSQGLPPGPNCGWALRLYVRWATNKNWLLWTKRQTKTNKETTLKHYLQVSKAVGIHRKGGMIRYIDLEPLFQYFWFVILILQKY